MSTTTTSTPPTVESTECKSAALTVTHGASSGAAGHVGFDLGFRNNSQKTCTLTGFPGVSFVDTSGKQIGEPVSRNTVSYLPVILKPGETGYALVVVTNPDVANCPSAVPSKIRIYPPNETRPVLIASLDGLRVCSAQTVPGYVNPVTDQSTN